ncbi:hypothetical protein EVAR_44131_1 [Eumeta japonica]|uniref:Uncharacterized protein n=1 Tax=Eumeta variegata TaxID=151549 RepID=A0A4C1XKS7_EUMVA|nr:hypothetical protein EVAR_44131_1 [Eumeta japonica]
MYQIQVLSIFVLLVAVVNNTREVLDQDGGFKMRVSQSENKKLVGGVTRGTFVCGGSIWSPYYNTHIELLKSLQRKCVKILPYSDIYKYSHRKHVAGACLR